MLSLENMYVQFLKYETVQNLYKPQLPHIAA